jgi:endoglucanase
MKTHRRLFAGILLSCIALRVEVQTAPGITETNTPAHQSALKFMRGVGLGNYLEYPPNTFPITYTAQDFKLIRAEGFDHVRLPIGWHLYSGPGPDFILSPNIFAKADTLMNSALSLGLGVILDFHKFDDFTFSPGSNKEQFYAIWRQVAAHYANAPPNVVFALLNEPFYTAMMNPIFDEVIRQIRITNPDRTIWVGPGQYNSIDELNRLSLPTNDKNLIVTVHVYDPYYFTHQGAEWALPDTATTGVIFPGPPAVPLKPSPTITHGWVLDWFRDYNNKPTAINPSSPASFKAKLHQARLWSDRVGRPVHVGEFGCYEKADAQSRVNLYKEIRNAMDAEGLGWAMWDWKAGFHYIKNGRPDPPGLREALFPSFELEIRSKGTIEFDAAKGKTFLVEKASSLALPVLWQPLSTQTLVSPKFLFNDPQAVGDSVGFYRVQWLK